MNAIKLSVLIGLLVLRGAVTYAASTVLSVGHTDIAVDYDAAINTWDLHVGYDVAGEEFPASDVLLRVNPLAQTSVPANVQFSFLGVPGSSIWILPQAEDPNLLFLGYGADGLLDGVFVGNQVQVTLTGYTGPGNFASYELDAFGNPVVFMNSRDGLSAADHFDLTAGGDSHLAWAFSQPGHYTLTLEAAGTLVNGNLFTASGPVNYNVEVVPEPGSIALLAIGLAMACRQFRRRRAHERAGQTCSA
jgi:surface-anchored protein